MQVGDHDREQVVAALRRHFADGKLSLDEFGDRVEAAYAAGSNDDLYQAVRDLDLLTPSPPPPPTAASASMVAAQSGAAAHAAAARPARPARAKPPAVPKDKAAIARKGFYAHLGPYVVVNAFLVMVYVLTSFGGYFWPIWPMMGWGVGLGIHAWAAFVLADRS